MTLTAHVDLKSFEKNIATIVESVAPARVWVAVKSHAYGHGMVELADNAISAGAAGLAVLDVPAALTLRSHGITTTLFAWLHGTDTDFESAIDAGIDLGVSTRAQLEQIARVGRGARVHLKIDTGLHRNGFPASEWKDVCELAAGYQRDGDIVVAGVWTHLADANPESDDEALYRFDDALDIARSSGLNPEFVHAAASPTALRNPRARYNLVRVGIAAYGISPFDESDGRNLGLTPVLTLSGTVLSSTDGIATVEGGWFTGIPQVSGDGAWVSVDGEPASIVAVDALTTSIRSDAGVGTVVTFIGGDGPTAELWAEWTGTIGDEILTGIPAAVRRVYER